MVPNVNYDDDNDDSLWMTASGDDPGINNQKTPTVLLLSPDGEFHSFGFTARDFYHDMDARHAMPKQRESTES